MSKSAKSAAVAAKPAKGAKAVSKAPVAKTTKPKVDPDTITQSKGVAGGKDAIVVVAGAGTVTIAKDRLTKQLNQLAVVGGSFAAVKEYLEKHGKAAPALARGVESRHNPHSSKALADSRAKAPAAAKPEGKPAKAPAAAKLPTKKASNDTPLTVLVNAKDSGLKPGSDRYQRLQAIEGCKTLGEALSKTIPGGKRVAMDNIRGMEKRAHVRIG